MNGLQQLTIFASLFGLVIITGGILRYITRPNKKGSIRTTKETIERVGKDQITNDTIKYTKETVTQEYL